MDRKNSEDRKNEIVNAVWELMLKEGTRGVTIKNISQKIGVTEGAVYRHFESKHDILMALVDSLECSLMKAIDSPIRKYKNPLDRLREVMRTHMVFTEERKGILFMIIAESVYFNDDLLRRRILEVIEKYKGRIKDILNEAKKEKLLLENINLETVSLAFFGLIQTAIIQFALTNYTVAPITKFNTLWGVFLQGIEKKKTLNKLKIGAVHAK